jgi:hypothetical protein
MSLDKDISSLRRSLKRHCEPWKKAVLEKQLEEALAERAASKAARDSERAAARARREAARQAARAHSAVVSANNIAPVSNSKYRGTTVDGQRLLAHRVAVGLAVGDEPEVHHVDHDVQNNSPMNLKKMSHQENCNLRRKREGTSSKFLGVSWDKSRGKYKSRIKLKNGTTKHLGYFAAQDDAADAYNKASIEEYGYGNKTINELSKASETVWDIIEAVIDDTDYLFGQVREACTLASRRTVSDRLETDPEKGVINGGILSQSKRLEEVAVQ